MPARVLLHAVRVSFPIASSSRFRLPNAGSVPRFTTDLADPLLVVGIEQTNGNQESCGFVQTSIAFRCSENVPAPGIVEWVPPSDPLQSRCVFNVSWTVDLVCPLPPAPDRPPLEGEGGAFALTTFLVIFLGGGLYFVGGTVVNSRSVQLIVLRRHSALPPADRTARCLPGCRTQARISTTTFPRKISGLVCRASCRMEWRLLPALGNTRGRSSSLMATKTQASRIVQDSEMSLSF